jgi:hypothetical protein
MESSVPYSDSRVCRSSQRRIKARMTVIFTYSCTDYVCGGFNRIFFNSALHALLTHRLVYACVSVACYMAGSAYTIVH